MSFICEDGNEISWTDHMVRDLKDFERPISFASACSLGVDAPIDPDTQWAVNRLNVSLQNLCAAKSNPCRLLGSHLDIISNKEGHMDPANANNLPEATYQDIVTEFKVLLDGLSDVTTLDVKNSLRNKGFW